MSGRITRRQFLTSAGAASAAALLAAHHPTWTSGVVGQQTYFPIIRNELAADQLNIITVMLDSLRYDHVGCNGNAWIHTPNIDAFANQAVVFDNFYAGGFPTLLNRAELFTGRWLYPFMAWGNLPGTETTIAQLLSAAGYLTGIVFDTYHLKDEGRTFERGFASWEWIRGQETDRYRPTPVAPKLPADPSKLRHGAASITQYLRNVSTRQSESDYFVAQTMTKAIAWLESVHDAGRFYLHIDSFDPHEPWDPPTTYVDLYDPGYVGDEVIFPIYAPPAYLSPAELRHVRALYAGEVTLVDRWFGELLAAIDRLGLAANTAVILMSDHGTLLGEHNAVGKAWDDGQIRRAYPLWQELAHVILLVRLPGVPARRTRALAQPPDIAATVMDLAAAQQPANLHGVSLVPILRTAIGETEPVARTVTVTARNLFTGLDQKPQITVNDGTWSLVFGGAHASSALYHLPSDAQQEVNLLAQECAIARNLHAQLVALLDSLGAPEDRIAPWRHDPCHGM